MKFILLWAVVRCQYFPGQNRQQIQFRFNFLIFCFSVNVVGLETVGQNLIDEVKKAYEKQQAMKTAPYVRDGVQEIVC